MNISENNFVNRLKAWRLGNFYSQEKAASLLGISRPYLNQIEKKRREPSAELVNKFAELEATPSEQPRLHEASPQYHEMVKKVTFIEEEGSDEQRALVNSFLDSVCEQLGLPKPEKSQVHSKRASTAARFVAYRNENRITQPELADILHMSLHDVELIESGQKDADARTLVMLGEIEGRLRRVIKTEDSVE